MTEIIPGSPPDNEFTRVPNNFLDNNWLFTGNEVKILNAVYRITFGWQTTEPQEISTATFKKLTGLDDKTIRSNIRSVIAKGWIYESKKRGKRGVKLYAPVIWDRAKLPKQNKRTTGTIPPVTTGTIPPVPGASIPQSEGTLKKEKESKKETPVAPDPFDQPVFTDDSRHALRVWREAGNGPDAWLTDKGRAQVMDDALKRFTIQQVCDALRFASKDQYQQGRLGSMHAVRDNIGIWVKMLAPGGSRVAQTFNRPDLQPFEDSDPGAGMILDQDGLE